MHYPSLIVIKLVLLIYKLHFAFWVQYKQKEGDGMKTTIPVEVLNEELGK